MDGFGPLLQNKLRADIVFGTFIFATIDAAEITAGPTVDWHAEIRFLAPPFTTFLIGRTGATKVEIAYQTYLRFQGLHVRTIPVIGTLLRIFFACLWTELATDRSFRGRDARSFYTVFIAHARITKDAHRSCVYSRIHIRHAGIGGTRIRRCTICAV